MAVCVMLVRNLLAKDFVFIMRANIFHPDMGDVCKFMYVNYTVTLKYAKISSIYAC